MTLTGEVADEAEKEAAEKTVLYTRGVRGIRNYITVVPPAKPADTVKFIEAVPPQNEPKGTCNHSRSGRRASAP